MPTRRPASSAKKNTPQARKVTSSVSETGAKRYVHWLCAPGNKCVPAEPPAFTESPQWRIFRIMAEFVEGFEFLSKLKGEVSVFGSARVTEDHPHYQTARKLGYLLGKNGYSVLTGGGPGIMEAANRGAFEAGAPSVGLDIELPMEQRRNQYVTKSMGFHYFFTRKVMLSASAQAYVFLPGGFGTMDEMTEMITLVQTGKIPSTVPIILIGKAFWQPFVAWVKQTVVMEGYVHTDEMNILQLVDTPEEALAIIRKTSERQFG